MGKSLKLQNKQTITVNNLTLMKKHLFLFGLFFIYFLSYSQDTIHIIPSTKLAKKILKKSDVYINFQGKTKLTKIDNNTIICPTNKDFSWHTNPKKLIKDSLLVLQFVSFRNCVEIKIPVYCIKKGCKFKLYITEYGKDWVSSTVKYGSTNQVFGCKYYKSWKIWKRYKCPK